MVAVTLGSYVTTKAPTAAEKAFKAYHAVSNDLLDMHWASVEAEAAIAKAKRLAERMDKMNEQYPVGTPERGEAEAIHWSLMQTAKRQQKVVKNRARFIAKTWPELGKYKDEIVQGVTSWSDSPMWEIVRTDPVLGRDKVWAHLIWAVDNAEVYQGEAPPF